MMGGRYKSVVLLAGWLQISGSYKSAYSQNEASPGYDKLLSIKELQSSVHRAQN
jgi:hypothetical protein